MLAKGIRVKIKKSSLTKKKDAKNAHTPRLQAIQLPEVPRFTDASQILIRRLWGVG